MVKMIRLLAASFYSKGFKNMTSKGKVAVPFPLVSVPVTFLFTVCFNYHIWNECIGRECALEIGIDRFFV